MTTTGLSLSVPQVRDSRELSLAAAFFSRFGEQPDCIASAPGRIILAGEQLDYQLGIVLNTAIDRRLYVAIKKRCDSIIAIESLDFELPAPRLNSIKDFTRSEGRRRTDWWISSYSLLHLLSELVRNRSGKELPGLSILIDSRTQEGGIPVGVGLSSSAALEVSLALAVFHALDIRDVPSTEIALLGKRSEEELGFFPGIQDQWSCLNSTPYGAKYAVANLFDCLPEKRNHGDQMIRSESVPIPSDLACIVIRIQDHQQTESMRWRHNLWVVESEVAATLLARELVDDLLGRGEEVGQLETYLASIDRLKPGNLRNEALADAGITTQAFSIQDLIRRVPDTVSLSQLMSQTADRDRLQDIFMLYSGTIRALENRALQVRNILGHFWEECQRARETAHALRIHNLRSFAQIQGQIGRSLKWNFNIQNDKADKLLSYLMEKKSILGGRILGPGGGSNAIVWYKKSLHETVLKDIREGEEDVELLPVAPGSTARIHPNPHAFV